MLREEIGYRGLVVSDDLDMGGVLNGASIEDAAVGTLEAGSDMFLVCQKEEHVWRAFEAVLKQAENDEDFAVIVAAKAKRVRRCRRSRRSTGREWLRRRRRRRWIGCGGECGSFGRGAVEWASRMKVPFPPFPKRRERMGSRDTCKSRDSRS